MKNKNERNINIFRCPYFQESQIGPVCEAAISIFRNNSIKDIDDISEEICTSKHFESCYIYLDKLRRMAISKLPLEVHLYDTRPHAFNNL